MYSVAVHTLWALLINMEIPSGFKPHSLNLRCSRFPLQLMQYAMPNFVLVASTSEIQALRGGFVNVVNEGLSFTSCFYFL